MRPADAAALFGVSRPRVSQLTAAGGRLAAAVQPDGSIDLAHPDVERWRAARGRRASETSMGAPADAQPPVDDAATSELAALQRRKRLAEVLSVEAKNDLTAGRAVSRELVSRFVGSHLETLHTRLLRDVHARLLVRFGRDAANAVRAIVSTELTLAVRGVRAGLAAAKVERVAPPLTATNIVVDVERDRKSAVREVAEAIKARLRTEALDKVVELTRKSLARTQFADFDAIMAASEKLAPDVATAAGAVIDAHIDNVVRELTMERSDGLEAPL